MGLYAIRIKGSTSIKDNTFCQFLPVVDIVYFATWPLRSSQVSSKLTISERFMFLLETDASSSVATDTVCVLGEKDLIHCGPVHLLTVSQFSEQPSLLPKPLGIPCPTF